MASYVGNAGPARRQGPGDDGRGELAVETEGLVKHFGPTRAVDGVDLRIPRGGVHGFLGPDGAGKTTTIRVLATLLRPDAGTARVFGHDVVTEPDAVRARVSLTGQFAGLDEDLSGAENLQLLARLHGYSRAAARQRTEQLLAAFGLGEAAGTQLRHYSGGRRRRIDIAASIVVRPDLIFLDEPTTGLDPCSRTQVWDVVRALVRGGTTVLLTTQHLDEADQLADRISVVDSGRVIAEGTPGELEASVGTGALHVRVRDPQVRSAARVLLERVLAVPVREESDPAALTARVDDPSPVARALTALEDADVRLVQFALGRPSLDDVFLALTGHPAGSAGTTTPDEEGPA